MQLITTLLIAQGLLFPVTHPVPTFDYTPAKPPEIVVAAPENTPATIVRPAASTQPTDVQEIIIQAANSHGVDPNWLLRVAACESGFNIYAHNPSGATGLFQFMPSTFYGNGGTDIYSATDQANIAAKMFAAGQSGQWVCK